jgi:hypothetical protein
MKKTNYFMALGLFGLLLFAACKKDDNGITTLTPKEQILTSKVWKLQSVTVPKISDPSADSSITKPCSDSALFAFDIYKKYQIADLETCDSTIIPYDKGSWILSAADSLSLNGSKRKLVWKVQVINDSIIKAVYRDSTAPDENWFKTITLKK